MSSVEESAPKRRRSTCPASPGAEALLNLDSSLTDLFNFSPLAVASTPESGAQQPVISASPTSICSPPAQTGAEPSAAAPLTSPVLCRKTSSASRRRPCRVRPTPGPAGRGAASPPPADFSQEPSQLTPRPRSVPAIERLRRRLAASSQSQWGAASPSLPLPSYGVSPALVSQVSGAPSSCEAESQRRRAALVRAAETELPPCSAVGPFHGLPSLVQTLLAKQRGITALYEWQEECLRLPAVLKRDNLVYSLPTSGGKTLVAELLILKEVLCRHRDAVLVLPYVAIVQEKVRALAPFGIALGFLIEEYAGSRGAFPPVKRRKRRVVYVCTIEKASGLVSSLLEADRISELGLVVVDEVHMLGESGGRGATLEILITKLKAAAPEAHLVGMSATIGNMDDLAAFLEAQVYQGQFRPVQLREHVLLDGQLLEVTGPAPKAPPLDADDWRALLTPRRTPLFQYTEQQRQRDPDGVGGLVAEVVPANSCLVFCPTRKNCEAVARLICSALKSELKEHALDKKKSLYAALVTEGGGTVCPVLRQTLPYGVAYHHSGLTTDERKLLEEAYLEGTLCCLCCTSTLAAGVNLPAKRVVLRSPYTGSAFLSRGRYKQMVGRAGRAGIDDSGESILIVSPRDAKLVGQLLTAPMERCVSTLLEQDGHGLRRLLLSAVALGLADSPAALVGLLGRTLLAKQAETLKVDLTALVTDTVAALRSERLLRISRRDGGTDPANPQPIAALKAVSERDANTDVKLDASRDDTRDASRDASRDATRDATRDYDPGEISAEELAADGRAWSETWQLKVSRLGTAAVKGNVDLRLAGRLYEDLSRAQSALAVINQLHLLYLVTPYDMMDFIQPCAVTFLDMYSALNEEEAAVARLIGVTEAQIVRMMSGKKASSMPVAHRFYLTLVVYEALRGGSLWDAAHRCQLQRGQLQALLQSTGAFSAAVLHFCRQLDELWPFVQLLDVFNRKLATGAAAELAQLLELPAVKQGRARALYAAGYRTLADVANADPEALVRTLDHLPRRVARQIVDSAKMLLLEKAEALQEEAEFLLDGIKSAQFHSSPGLGEVLLNSARADPVSEPPLEVADPATGPPQQAAGGARTDAPSETAVTETISK
ncbi:helicase POLQ-like [Amphibalanus amphitrite]|uniref:helicase POLQ-like n=1 Tax=Amphibalanus amphitrite TaxID=1232801 RepID=UPI001C912DCC|nr:helicase POLQ-like [Amphibalanus amphitrite]XP_043192768.1 helicase POLQ-like [Amphibalanus amphitrite]XP_043192769.1 helicase POLQ-like [Amphibalanus amphitrite]